MNSRMRRQVISDWMGVYLPQTAPLIPPNLHQLFEKAFAKLGLKNRLQESNLNDSWTELIGPSLAAHCHPQGVRRGTLMVLVDHPAWLHQINMAHKRNILQAVQQRFPHLNVKDISLRIG